MKGTDRVMIIGTDGVAKLGREQRLTLVPSSA
jgi:hypothetical protein